LGVNIWRATLVVFMMTTVFSLGLTSIPAYALFLTPVEIIDNSGDGGGNILGAPFGITTDSSGNVFVVGQSSNNAFKITPGGTITEIIDNSGDGGGNTLTQPFAITTDSSGNVFVTGTTSNNAFKITPGGTITEIIDATGDGGGNPLNGPVGITTDSSDNVFVTGGFSDNAFKITPTGICGTDTSLVGEVCEADVTQAQLDAALADLVTLQGVLDQALEDLGDALDDLADALLTIMELEALVEELGQPGPPAANQGEGQGAPAQGKNKP